MVPSWPRRTPEIAEMIDRKRDIGGGGLADRLAVIPGLGLRQQIEVLLHPVGDFQQYVGALGRGGLAPCGAGGMRRIQREVHVFRTRARDLTDLGAGDRRDVVEILSLPGGHECVADEIVITGLEGRGMLARRLCHLVHVISSIYTASCRCEWIMRAYGPRDSPALQGRAGDCLSSGTVCPRQVRSRAVPCAGRASRARSRARAPSSTHCPPRVPAHGSPRRALRARSRPRPPRRSAGHWRAAG